MLYRFIQILVKIGMRLYYSEVKVKHSEYLEHDGPMIIIANHPNTLVDAWLVGNVCKQPIYFMAKGTFFSSKLKMYFLRSLNLIPINRATESKTKGVSNDASFEECYKVLEQGKTLVIYPEGNSHMERVLRELKSGTARIALEAEKRNGGKLNLKVVPMGLIYLQAEKFRSSIMVNVGEGSGVTHHLAEFENNNSGASKKLTEEFRSQLEKVLVTTQSKEQENLIEELVEATQSRYRGEAKGVEEQVEFMKKVRDRIEMLSLMEPWKIEEIQNLLRNINWRLDKLKIKSDFLDRKFRSAMFIRQILFSIIFSIIGFPIFLFGFIHNYLPFKTTDLIVPKLVKNLEYYAPVAILLGLVMYPLNYLGFVYLSSFFVEIPFWAKLIYFILMPITGMYAHAFVRYLKHISFKWNYIFLVMNEREGLIELKKQRQKLYDMIFE